MSGGPGGWAFVPALVAQLAWSLVGHAAPAPAGPPARPAAVHRAPPQGASYPYGSARCEYGASGGPSCADPADAGDLYNWGYYHGKAFDAGDQWGYEYRNCTSYVAWRLSQAGVRPALFSGLGDAGQWMTGVAGEPGVVVNEVASPGAVAVWVDDSGVGHVAWVDAVHGGRVTVSDYNYAGTGAFDEHVIAAPPDGYIHFPGS